MQDTRGERASPAPLTRTREHRVITLTVLPRRVAYTLREMPSLTGRGEGIAAIASALVFVP